MLHFNVGLLSFNFEVLRFNFEVLRFNFEMQCFVFLALCDVPALCPGLAARVEGIRARRFVHLVGLANQPGFAAWCAVVFFGRASRKLGALAVAVAVPQVVLPLSRPVAAGRQAAPLLPSGRARAKALRSSCWLRLWLQKPLAKKRAQGRRRPRQVLPYRSRRGPQKRRRRRRRQGRC